MPMVDGAGMGTRMGFTELVGDGGHCFGVAPNMEQTLLVAGVEANLVVNMTVHHWHRVQEIEGDLGDGSLLGGTMAGVDGMARVEEMVGTRVVSESSP